jgi:TrpR-related protein YerC/YecD
MQDLPKTVWSSPMARQLAAALTSINDLQTMQNFLRDVLTEKELSEINARLEAAKMLKAGKTYTEITAATKLSSRTVARISSWLQNGAGGYAAVLPRLTADSSDGLTGLRSYR